MAQMSKKIQFHDDDKLKKVNPETIKLWKKYEADMSLRNLSDGTIKGYRNDIEHLWIYTYDNLDNVAITELTEDDLTEFFYFCKTEGNNPKRIKRRMSSISAFYKYLRKKKIISENPMEFIDRPARDVDVITQTFLTKEQIADLRIKLEANYKDAKTVSQKHLALSYLCYAMFSLSTMARVTAVSNIMWQQINFDDRVVLDVLEKEAKVVTLYFSEDVKNLLMTLKSFRDENNIDDTGYVFISKDTDGYHKVSSNTLSQWCKKIGAIINVPTLHPHDFRHSSSTILRNSGMALEDIAVLLNHESTETTLKYYIRRDDSKVVAKKDELGI